MWINFISVAVLIFVVFIGFAGYSLAKNRNTEVPGQSIINQQLSELKEVAFNPENEMSAMCYDMSYTPVREDYSCPVCHNTTYYPSIPDPFSVENPYSSEIKNIHSYRFTVKTIKKIDVKLDESEFCKTCNPNVKNPKFYLIVNYSDKAKDHKVSDFTGDDLVLLYEFSEGKKVHRTYDKELLLKNYEKRLEELLGVDINL